MQATGEYEYSIISHTSLASCNLILDIQIFVCLQVAKCSHMMLQLAIFAGWPHSHFEILKTLIQPIVLRKSQKK